MSREIKFRTWDNKLNKWQNGYELSNTGKEYVFDTDRFEVEQYTSFDGANGIPIYEGDILKLDVMSLDPKVNLYVVKYDKEFGYCLICYDNAQARSYRQEYWTTAHTLTFKVVGNIHESPELIKIDELTL